MATLTQSDRAALRLALAESCYTQSTLAAAAGISREHLAQVVSVAGRREPSDDLLRTLCGLLGLPLEIVPATVRIGRGNGKIPRKKRAAAERAT